MGDEPNSGDQQDKAESKSKTPLVLKLNARQKAYQRAQDAYKATHRLGKRLSQTAGRLTTSEIIAAVLTAVIAGATVWNVVVVQRTLPILQGQLDEMRDEQRPWIYSDSFAPQGPITISDGKIEFRMDYTAINVGKSTASDVRAHAVLLLEWLDKTSLLRIPPSVNGGKAIENWASRTRSICNAPTPPAGNDIDVAGIGDAIFPNQSVPTGVNIDQKFVIPKSAESYMGVLVLCIDYGSKYSTRYVFTITRRAKERPDDFTVFDAQSAVVPKSEVRIGYGTQYAD